MQGVVLERFTLGTKPPQIRMVHVDEVGCVEHVGSSLCLCRWLG